MKKLLLLALLLICPNTYSQTEEHSVETNQDTEYQIQTPENKNNYSFYIGSSLPSLFSNGENYWELGWAMTALDRITLGIGMAHNVSDDNGTEIEASDDEDTPPTLTRDDSETDSLTLGVSYLRKMMTRGNVDLLLGMGVSYNNIDSKTKKTNESFNNDIDASTLSITQDQTIESKVNSLLFLLECEYAVLKDMKIGFIYTLSYSRSETLTKNRTESIQISDGVSVGESDPNITEDKSESSGLLTSKSGIFLRYFF